MTKANAEIKYDPELPFALVRIKAEGETFPLGVVEARTRLLADANDLAGTYKGGWVKVIDTTPKPKIPEGAEFVTWQMNGANEVAIYVNFNTNKAWEWYGMYYSEEDLLKEIGEAEVTVLVRKDET